MKNCFLLYNKNASGFKEKYLDEIEKILNRYDYDVTLVNSNKKGFMEKFIEFFNDEADLILTMGGDGTVRSAYEGFYELNKKGIEQKALYGHIPGGTTNDMAVNTGLPRYNPVEATKFLMNGKVENRDIILVNDKPMAYITALGILAPVTYLIDDKNKKHGTLSYFKYGAEEFFKDPMIYRKITKKPYKVNFKYDGKSFNSSAIFVGILNARSFGHLRIDPKARMDDGKFKVMFIRSQSDLFKVINYYLARHTVIDSPNLLTFETDKVDLKLNRLPEYNANIDGDEANFPKTDEIHAEVKGKIKQLVGRRF